MRRPLSLILAGLFVAVAACATVKEVVDADTARLERFKALQAERRYEAIAAEQVACDPEGAACRQLRLIKGDACLVLAARGDAPRQRYGCAIEELSAGLDYGRGQPTAIASLVPFQERLMEALRARQDLARSRAEAAPFTAALRVRAARFRSEHPDHPAGPYYAASARLTEILNAVTAGEADAATCTDLDRVLATVQGAPATPAYATNYARLRADIAGVRPAVPGCAR